MSERENVKPYTKPRALSQRVKKRLENACNSNIVYTFVALFNTL